MLKDYLNAYYPHLLRTGQSRAAVGAFQAAIEEAWLALDSAIIDGCILLIMRRVEAVIKAKGWYTKY